jgi:hypothetical protein
MRCNNKSLWLLNTNWRKKKIRFACHSNLSFWKKERKPYPGLICSQCPSVIVEPNLICHSCRISLVVNKIPPSHSFLLPLMIWNTFYFSQHPFLISWHELHLISHDVVQDGRRSYRFSSSPKKFCCSYLNRMQSHANLKRKKNRPTFHNIKSDLWPGSCPCT